MLKLNLCAAKLSDLLKSMQQYYERGDLKGHKLLSASLKQPKKTIIIFSNIIIK